MKNVHGITLVALIITVIILLILAGTAISISINGGNLFGKSDNAVKEWNSKVEEEYNSINKVLDILDLLNDGVGTPTSYMAYSVGDIVTLGTSENAESFYVIEASDENTDTVKLITAKNIETINYTQSDSAGKLAFDSTEPNINSYSDSTIKIEVDNYKNRVQERTGKTINEARLMLYSEAMALTDNSLYTEQCTGTRAFINATNYWLGSIPNIDNTVSMYGVYGNGKRLVFQRSN